MERMPALTYDDLKTIKYANGSSMVEDGASSRKVEPVAGHRLCVSHTHEQALTANRRNIRPINDYPGARALYYL